MAALDGHYIPTPLADSVAVEPAHGTPGYTSETENDLYLMRGRVIATSAITYWLSGTPDATQAPGGPGAVTQVVVFQRL